MGQESHVILQLQETTFPSPSDAMLQSHGDVQRKQSLLAKAKSMNSDLIVASFRHQTDSNDALESTGSNSKGNLDKVSLSLH